MIVSRDQALTNGFATYNGGPHLTVEVPDGHFTATFKNSDGHQVTVAFAPCYESTGHHCVDIQRHGGPTTEGGHTIQKATLRGPDGRNGECDYDDKKPTTLVVLSLPTRPKD